MSETKVLVVAHVRIYREFLAATLATRRGLVLVGASASRADARERICELHPDVIVIDMAIRESLDLIHDLRGEAFAPKVLAFAIDEAASDILECAEVGAAGYVTANASITELFEAIERAARNELVCPPRIAAQLFVRLSGRAERWFGNSSQVKPLTSREREVLQGIRRGLSNKEIGRELNIAECTVKNHVHHLLEKLDVTTRAQAAARSNASIRQRPVCGPAA